MNQRNRNRKPAGATSAHLTREVIAMLSSEALALHIITVVGTEEVIDNYADELIGRFAELVDSDYSVCRDHVVKAVADYYGVEVA